MTIIAGPCPCQGCGQLVWWARPTFSFYGLPMKGRAGWYGADAVEHRCG